MSSGNTAPPPLSLVRRVWRGRWGYAFIAPAVALLMLVHVYPICRVFALSVQRFDVVAGTGSFVGLANYRGLLTDELFYVALRNTCLYTLLVVPFALVLALCLAYLVEPLPV